MALTQLPDSEITHSIIGCAMKVHTALRSGFPEVIYQRALEIEFNKLQINFRREFDMNIHYDNQIIGTRKVDFLVDKRICVELKATTTIEDIHLAQALNYLEVLNLPTGLLINFGAKSLQFHRLYNKKHRPNL